MQCDIFPVKALWVDMSWPIQYYKLVHNSLNWEEKKRLKAQSL